MKKTGIVLAGLLCAGAVLASGRPPVVSSSKPNVLFIAIDDLRNFVNCFGYEQAITPNMDRLAEQSTVFLNAHNQAPMCGPSRASVMTGIQPYNSGAYGFVDWREVPVLKAATTLNRHFKDNGYHTMGGGKIYHGNAGDSDWSEVYCKANHKGGTWGEKEVKKEDLALQAYGGMKRNGPVATNPGSLQLVLPNPICPGLRRGNISTCMTLQPWKCRWCWKTMWPIRRMRPSSRLTVSKL
jgi:hypothetical protein